MQQSTKVLRAFVVTLALSTVAGCAQQASPPPQAAAAPSGPELAGAWYQVYFDTNSTTVNARGQMVVKDVAAVVAKNDTTRVTVIGKTDRVGAAPANMALSHRRADVIRDALVTAGVPAARIDTSWSGENQQAVATAGQVDEARDRVVDITVVKQSP